jgi:hypothetical protein
MNIEHEGKTYEVTPGICNDTTHVLHPVHGLAPLFFEATTFGQLPSATCLGTRLTIYSHNGGSYCEVGYLEQHGIQPLRLVPNEPVTFEAWTAIVNFHGNDVVAIICPKDVHIDMKFQCVAVDK